MILFLAVALFPYLLSKTGNFFWKLIFYSGSLFASKNMKTFFLNQFLENAFSSLRGNHGTVVPRAPVKLPRPPSLRSGAFKGGLEAVWSLWVKIIFKDCDYFWQLKCATTGMFLSSDPGKTFEVMHRSLCIDRFGVVRTTAAVQFCHKAATKRNVFFPKGVTT